MFFIFRPRFSHCLFPHFHFVFSYLSLTIYESQSLKTNLLGKKEKEKDQIWQTQISNLNSDKWAIDTQFINITSPMNWIRSWDRKDHQFTKEIRNISMQKSDHLEVNHITQDVWSSWNWLGFHTRKIFPRKNKRKKDQIFLLWKKGIWGKRYVNGLKWKNNTLSTACPYSLWREKGGETTEENRCWRSFEKQVESRKSTPLGFRKNPSEQEPSASYELYIHR